MNRFWRFCPCLVLILLVAVIRIPSGNAFLIGRLLGGSATTTTTEKPTTEFSYSNYFRGIADTMQNQAYDQMNSMKSQVATALEPEPASLLHQTVYSVLTYLLGSSISAYGTKKIIMMVVEPILYLFAPLFEVVRLPVFLYVTVKNAILSPFRILSG